MTPFHTFLLWAGYFALHSLLADDRLKRAITRRFPRVVRFYRLLYSTLAAGLLAGLLFKLWRAPADYFFTLNWLSQVAGGLIVLAGAGLGFLAFRQYNLEEFFGFQQIKQKSPLPVLRTDGLNARVRHPLYAGILLFVAGLGLLVPTGHFWAVATSIFAYVPVGIYLEEKKLLRQFGTAYAEYQRRVRRLIPGVW